MPQLFVYLPPNRRWRANITPRCKRPLFVAAMPMASVKLISGAKHLKLYNQTGLRGTFRGTMFGQTVEGGMSWGAFLRGRGVG